MEYKNKVITISNNNNYLVIEQRNYENQTYLYIVNENDETDTMFCKINKDGQIDKIPVNNEVFIEKIFPLFEEKFDTNLKDLDV